MTMETTDIFAGGILGACVLISRPAFYRIMDPIFPRWFNNPHRDLPLINVVTRLTMAFLLIVIAAGMTLMDR